jgi:hypothetical protein
MLSSISGQVAISSRKIAYCVELLLVVGSPGFHQQPRNPILNLHDLMDEQLSISQSAPRSLISVGAIWH